jgi:hypothetical protein
VSKLFLLTTVLMTIPCSFLVLFISLSLQRVVVPLNRLGLAAVVAGLALSFFRLLPVPFGLHTLLYFVLIILLVRYLSGGRWAMAVMGSLLTSVLSAIGEGLIAVPVISSMGYTLVDTLSSPWLTLLGGWIGNSLLVLLSLYLWIGRGGAMPGGPAHEG